MFSKGGLVLKIYKQCEGIDKPVGRNEIWTDRESNLDQKQDRDAKAIRKMTFSFKNIENHD
jgi:hypothetical protein